MAGEFKAQVDGDNVVLTMPIDTLVFACENNPENPLKVKDRAAFVQYIAENLIEHGEDEAGDSALYRLLDALFVAAYQDGFSLESR